MNPLDSRKAIQAILGVTQDGVIGAESLAALHALINAPNDSTWPVESGMWEAGSGKFADSAPAPLQTSPWPFEVRVDGEDLVVEDIVITCFGGTDDPQDDGATASGLNTKTEPELEGVSVAMDGRFFAGLSAAEHAALDGSPIPRLPFFTPVQVTIRGITTTPARGIVDLGPGRQASHSGAPHALDLTVAAAAKFAPEMNRRQLAAAFEARGSFRILGGAKHLAGQDPIRAKE